MPPNYSSPESLVEQISEADQLHQIIKEGTDSNCTCPVTSPELSDHQHCQPEYQAEAIPQVPLCPRKLINLMIHVIATKPSLYDDQSKMLLSEFFKRRDMRATGLITEDVLRLLYSKNKVSQCLVWLKFEAFLIKMVKDRVYKPKDMSNEVIAIIKHEHEPELAFKFSSVLKSCIDTCRQISNKVEPDQEEQEKWCEIMDWISWLLSGNGADMD